MRRAISWVYCAPKSRIRTRSACASGVMRSSIQSVVGGLFGDDHVVHVALGERRLRDAHEARLLAQLGEMRGAEIAHAGAQAADHLMDVGGEAAAIRDAAFDAFGHELRRFL